MGFLFLQKTQNPISCWRILIVFLWIQHSRTFTILSPRSKRISKRISSDKIVWSIDLLSPSLQVDMRSSSEFLDSEKRKPSGHLQRCSDLIQVVFLLLRISSHLISHEMRSTALRSEPSRYEKGQYSPISSLPMRSIELPQRYNQHF